MVGALVVVVGLPISRVVLRPIFWQRRCHRLNGNPQEISVLLEVHAEVCRELLHFLDGFCLVRRRQLRRGLPRVLGASVPLHGRGSIHAPRTPCSRTEASLPLHARSAAKAVVIARIGPICVVVIRCRGLQEAPHLGRERLTLTRHRAAHFPSQLPLSRWTPAPHSMQSRARGASHADAFAENGIVTHTLHSVPAMLLSLLIHTVGSASCSLIRVYIKHSQLFQSRGLV